LANNHQNKGDSALWRKIVEACEKCLELDRDMVAKIEIASEGPRDVEEYLDPALWEQFIAARQDLCDFTTSSIELLTRKAPQKNKKPDNPNNLTVIDGQQAESEKRLFKSISEMLELEEKLTSYLNENLTVLKGTIDELTKNQTIFSQYSRNYSKPDPGYVSSQA
jgi:hypothetical protein